MSPVTFITGVVRLETKYRDIADGNISSRLAAFFVLMLETKYRDIADGNFLSRLDEVLHLLVGNQVPRYSGWKRPTKVEATQDLLKLETKYRDIADGNNNPAIRQAENLPVVGNQVPRYSGWKLESVGESPVAFPCWKPSTAI